VELQHILVGILLGSLRCQVQQKNNYFRTNNFIDECINSNIAQAIALFPSTTVDSEVAAGT
jgi:hypothetical protein